MLSRRSFFAGALAAPAIVGSGILTPETAIDPLELAIGPVIEPIPPGPYLHPATGARIITPEAFGREVMRRLEEMLEATKAVRPADIQLRPAAPRDPRGPGPG